MRTHIRENRTLKTSTLAGMGMALLPLASVHAASIFEVPYPLVTNADSSQSYSVNLARHLDRNTGTLLSSATATYANDASPQFGPSFAIDGDDEPWRWVSTTYAANGNQDPDATGVLKVALDRVYTINKIRQMWEGTRYSTQFSIRVSTDNVNWTPVVPLTNSASVAVGGDIFSTFAPRQARYVELTTTGLGTAINQASLFELGVFAASTATAPVSGDGLDLAYMNGVSVTYNGGAAPSVLDKQTTGVSGAANATVDGLLVINLGQIFPLHNVGLKFRQSQLWTNGGKVEVGPTLSNMQTVFDTGLGPDLSSMNVNFGIIQAQFVRITNYYSDGTLAGTTAGTGTQRLDEVEIFAAPEPASLGLIGVIGATLLSRQRRSRYGN